MIRFLLSTPIVYLVIVFLPMCYCFAKFKQGGYKTNNLTFYLGTAYLLVNALVGRTLINILFSVGPGPTLGSLPYMFAISLVGALPIAIFVLGKLKQEGKGQGLILLQANLMVPVIITMIEAILISMKFYG